MVRTKFNIAARLSHVALEVSDLDASIEFYKQWLGMSVVIRRCDEQDGDVAVLGFNGFKDNNMFLVLIDGLIVDKKEGNRHIGFDVETVEEIEEIARKAIQAGILIWPAREHSFGMLCAITDPDGHIIEFVESRSWEREFSKANGINRGGRKLGK